MAIRINKSLRVKPKIGPIPADQFLPWTLFILAAYIILKIVFQRDWIWVIGTGLWLCGTWWLLTHKGAYRFFSRFVIAPHWVRSLETSAFLLEKCRETQKLRGE